MEKNNSLATKFSTKESLVRCQLSVDQVSIGMSTEHWLRCQSQVDQRIDQHSTMDTHIPVSFPPALWCPL